jgi:hypothetical protein
MTNKRAENTIDSEQDWYSELEHKVLTLEQEISAWRETRAREDSPAVHGPRPRELLRVAPRPEHRRPAATGSTRPFPAAGRGEARDQVADRAQVLIDRGRRTAKPPRAHRGRRIAVGTAAGLAALTVGAMIVFRAGPSWPASVATMKTEIAAACRNPDVASEPGQVNFACEKDTSQILWAFALMTSNGDPAYADAKTGRKGLEPITAAQGGQIAWSLNLHHPYDPARPVDSLEVAARAINNIIGGATLTATNGSPTVQPGLESKPANCARYTGSPAVISRAGFPSRCASPVTSPQGQAALVADAFGQWMPGATAVSAQDVSVLFENADDPGNPQVQAILQGLPGAGGN